MRSTPWEFGDAFAENAQRLGAVTAARVVDDEARGVLRAHRLVPAAQRAAPASASPTHGAVSRPSTTSTTFISGTGLKEMKAGDALGRLHAAAIAVIERTRCGRHQAIPGNDVFQRVEQLALGLQVFHDRLDDDGQEESTSSESAMTRFACARASAFLLEAAFSASLASCAETDSFASRAAPSGCRGAARGCRLRGDLGDAASHDAGADHRQAPSRVGNG